MQSQIDYYRILGVSSDAEGEVISAAYRALMKKYHPDKNGSDAGDTRARQINEAYSILSDPAKRAAYDHIRRAKKQSTSEKSTSSNHAKPKETAAKQPAPVQPIENEPSPWKPVAVLGGVTMFIAAIAMTGRGNSDDLAANLEAETMSLENVVAPVSATDDLPKKLSDLDMSPVDFKNIENGASKFAAVFTSRGLLGARAYSENCHKKTSASPTWETADFCAAFDFAAVFVDEGVSKIADISANSYFKFKSQNQEQDYANAGADQFSLNSRLSTIRETAQLVVSEAIDAQIAKSEAMRARENLPLSAEVPAPAQDPLVARGDDASDPNRIVSSPPPVRPNEQF